MPPAAAPVAGGDGAYVDVSVNLADAVAQYDRMAGATDRLVASTSKLDAALTGVETGGNSVAAATAKVESAAERAAAELKKQADAAREVSAAHKAQAADLEAQARRQDGIARQMSALSRQSIGDTKEEIKANREKGRAAAEAARQAAAAFREQAKDQKAAAAAATASARELDGQLRAQQGAISATTQKWMGLAFVMQDATQFSQGLAAGLRATLNNLAPMALMLGVSGPIIVGLTALAIAAGAFGDKIVSAFQRGIASVADFKSALENAVSVNLSVGDYEITTPEQARAFAESLRQQARDVQGTIPEGEGYQSSFGRAIRRNLPAFMLEGTEFDQADQDENAAIAFRDQAKALEQLALKFEQTAPRIKRAAEEANLTPKGGAKGGRIEGSLPDQVEKAREALEKATAGGDASAIGRASAEYKRLQKAWSDLTSTAEGAQGKKGLAGHIQQVNQNIADQAALLSALQGPGGADLAMTERRAEALQHLVGVQRQALAAGRSMYQQLLHGSTPDPTGSTGSELEGLLSGVAFRDAGYMAREQTLAGVQRRDVLDRQDRAVLGIGAGNNFLDLTQTGGADPEAQDWAVGISKGHAEFELLKKDLEETDALAAQLASTFEGALAGSITDLASSLPELIDGTKSVTEVLLGSIGGMLQQMGAAMIAAGVAKLNLDAFFTPGAGPAMIAAGAGLVAVGAALQHSLKDTMSSKGMGTGSGGGGYAGRSYASAPPDTTRPGPYDAGAHMDYERLGQSVARGMQPYADRVSSQRIVAPVQQFGTALDRRSGDRVAWLGEA